MGLYRPASSRCAWGRLDSIDRRYVPYAQAPSGCARRRLGNSVVPQAPYRGEDLVHWSELVQYLVGARAPRLLDARGIQGRAQDQHSHVGIGLAQVGDQVCPTPVRQAQVQNRHVQLEPRDLLAGLGERSGLRDQLDVRLIAQQELHELPEVSVIFEDHDAGSPRLGSAGHSEVPCGKGTLNRTLVPRPSSLSISKRPPPSAALSRMLANPTPGCTSGPKPTPSSLTSVSKSSPSVLRLTETLFAPECLRALVSASWSTRETCVPVSPSGPEGTSSPTLRSISISLALVRFSLTTDRTISGKGRSSSSSMRRSFTTSRRPWAPRLTASTAPCSRSSRFASSDCSMIMPRAAAV